MARKMKECCICGKTYIACSTVIPGVFRWQDVACSLECAREYFRRMKPSEESDSIDKAEQTEDSEKDNI